MKRKLEIDHLVVRETDWFWRIMPWVSLGLAVAILLLAGAGK